MQTEASRQRRGCEQGAQQRARARGGAAEKWQGSKAMWSKGRVVVVSAAAKRGVWFVLFCTSL